jgi:hypothetical protein
MRTKLSVYAIVKCLQVLTSTQIKLYLDRQNFAGAQPTSSTFPSSFSLCFYTGRLF